MATIRQKIAAQKLSEYVRNSPCEPVNMGRIFLESGYSETVAKSPQRVTETKGWQELMEEILPHNDLLSAHASLLDSKQLRRMKFNSEVSDEVITDLLVSTNKELISITDLDSHKEVIYLEVDVKVVLAALDMAYKVHGHYKAVAKVEIDPIRLMSDKELDSYLSSLK